MIRLPDGILKRNPEQLLEGDLNILINKIEITDLETQQKRRLNQQERQALRNEILQRIKDPNLKYFEEQEMINLIKDAVNSFNLPNPNEILDQIIETRGTGEHLKTNWKNSLENYFRNSLEKEGINFRDTIEDGEELRAWLYLVIQDPNLKTNFEQDFQKALSQREKFYFRLWSPHIGVRLRRIIPPVLGIEPGFNVGEFFKEVRSYIEDLNKGKSRITFYFEESLLPDEFKDQRGNPDEQKLNQAGIRKVGNEYEFSITPEDITRIFSEVASNYTEIIKGDAEVNNLLKETKNLYRETINKAPEELRNSLAGFLALIAGIEENYKQKLETGISNKEIENMKKNLVEIKNFLNSIKEPIDAGETKTSEGLMKLKSKVTEFMKGTGVAILTGLGFWFLALGWFLPLFLIDQMYKRMEKFLGGK